MSVRSEVADRPELEAQLEQLLERCAALRRESVLLQEETDDLLARVTEARIHRSHARGLAGVSVEARSPNRVAH